VRPGERGAGDEHDASASAARLTSRHREATGDGQRLAVMKPASSEARKTTAGARRRGRRAAPRDHALEALRELGLLSRTLLKSGVSDGAGHTQLTLMRWRATSRATPGERDEPIKKNGISSSITHKAYC